MKKARNKIRIRVRGRQRLTMKLIMIYSACSAAILIFLMMFFNMTDIPRLKAKSVEIRQAEEQVFRNEMSLPAPEIKFEKNAGPNTIFIREIKQSKNLPELKHE